MPVDLAERLRHADGATEQIEPLDLEREQLARPQARVGPSLDQHGEARIDRGGEQLDLDRGEEVHLLLGPAGQAAHVGGDVDRKPLGVHRRVQHHDEHRMGVADSGGAEPALDQGGDPLADHHPVDACQRRALERRQDLEAAALR